MTELKQYEYYRSDLGVLYCGDCMEILPLFEDKCYDCFMDPKYNVGKDYDNCNDSMPENEYKEWIENIFNETKRISLILTVYVAKKWNLFYWNTLGEEYQEIMLPFRPAGALRYGFSNQFNKLLTNSKPKKSKPILNVWDNMQQPGLGFFFRENTYNHPGYTSEAITARVLAELCRDNSIILDPFMGSGTTAVAAEKQEKYWIGIEISEKYCEIAAKRIEKESRQGKFNL